MSDLTDTAVATGFASFMATFGRVPENFELLAQHAPEAFAGYGLMRSSVMRDRQDGGALELKTKELIFRTPRHPGGTDARRQKSRSSRDPARPDLAGAVGGIGPGDHGRRDHDVECHGRRSASALLGDDLTSGRRGVGGRKSGLKRFVRSLQR